MAKRKNDWNNDIKKRRIDSGRGCGEYENYKPWIVAQDFSSQGSMYRIKGVKTKRIHHLFSKTMYNFFLYCEYNDRVLDIKESFPLHDLYEVLENPEDIDLKKFTDKKSGELYVQTVSFMLKCLDDDGNEVNVARSCKYASELRKKVSIESLELKRRYFELKKVNWKLVTNKEIDKIVIQNIEYFREGADLDYDSNYKKEYILDLIEVLFLRIIRSKRSMLEEIRTVQDDYAIDRGMAVLLLKHLFWKKRLKWDIRKKFDITLSCKCVVNDKNIQEEEMN